MRFDGPSRRDFLSGLGALAVLPAFASLPKEEPIISAEDLAFLRRLAAETIASATRYESVATLGFPVITPGGAYPAFWIRDFSMAAGCGLISKETLRHHIRLIALSQSDTIRRLKNGASIPLGSIPDHVNYDGGAVFFPGTYSSGEDQGGEPWGIRPPVDDQLEFVHLAYLFWKGSEDPIFLGEEINGIKLFDRLQSALEHAYSLPDGLIFTFKRARAVGFGFCDGIYFTGKMLFPSLLKYRALGEMIELAESFGSTYKVAAWKASRKAIAANLAHTFSSKGWLKAATEIGGQPDIWGTIYAIYLDAVKGEAKTDLRKTVCEAVRKGTITYKGAVRHVPTDHDFSPTSAWEKTAGEPLNRYQNGAYWHVPTGWLARVVWEEDKPLARQIVKDMIAHFREEDFRLGKGNGAPWECLHPDGSYRQNPIYMASVTLPLEALSSLPLNAQRLIGPLAHGASNEN